MEREGERKRDNVCIICIVCGVCVYSVYSVGCVCVCVCMCVYLVAVDHEGVWGVCVYSGCVCVCVWCELLLEPPNSLSVPVVNPIMSDEIMCLSQCIISYLVSLPLYL